VHLLQRQEEVLGREGRAWEEEENHKKASTLSHDN